MISSSSGRKRRTRDGEARRSAPRQQHPALPMPVHAGPGGERGQTSRKARRRGVRASSLLLLLPHSSLLPLHLGCAGALKHSCSAERRAEVAGRPRLEGKKVQVSPMTLLLSPGTKSANHVNCFYVRSLRDLTSVLYALS